jgi:hypothetical protein
MDDGWMDGCMDDVWMDVWMMYGCMEDDVWMYG